MIWSQWFIAYLPCHILTILAAWRLTLWLYPPEKSVLDGGIEVCVQPWTAGGDANLSDQASGWNAVADGYNVKKGGDQYLHLAAAQ